MVKVAVTVATGVNTDRSRAPLVMHAAQRESGAVRLTFFRDLVARSLTRGGVSDLGGVYGARRPLPGCDRQGWSGRVGPAKTWPAGPRWFAGAEQPEPLTTELLPRPDVKYKPRHFAPLKACSSGPGLRRRSSLALDPRCRRAPPGGGSWPMLRSLPPRPPSQRWRARTPCLRPTEGHSDGPPG